jgi:hypothetical protein
MPSKLRTSLPIDAVAVDERLSAIYPVGLRDEHGPAKTLRAVVVEVAFGCCFAHASQAINGHFIFII